MERCKDRELAIEIRDLIPSRPDRIERRYCVEPGITGDLPLGIYLDLCTCSFVWTAPVTRWTHWCACGYRVENAWQFASLQKNISLDSMGWELQHEDEFQAAIVRGRMGISAAIATVRRTRGLLSKSKARKKRYSGLHREGIAHHTLKHAVRNRPKRINPITRSELTRKIG